jgi:Tyrosine phosphatase family
MSKWLCQHHDMSIQHTALVQSVLCRHLSLGKIHYTPVRDPAAPVQIVLAAVEEGEPLMFYCKAGKDRTGLLAMLILSVCRVPDDEIVADYHMCATPLLLVANHVVRHGVDVLSNPACAIVPCLGVTKRMQCSSHSTAL